MQPNNARQDGGAPDPQNPQDTQTAATNLIRSQISALYGDENVIPQAATENDTTGPSVDDQPASTNPYDRVHDAHPKPQEEQWKAYHSAWQTYYQKYYEAFYAHQETQKQASAPQSSQQGYFSNQPEPEPTQPEELSKDQALLELREKLLGNVRTRATKIRKSRHFMPIAAALAVVLLFTFLQYNRVLLATVNAYVSPGSIDPQNIVIEPTDNTAVSDESRLIIPKINVDVPVLYDVGNDHESQMDAMEQGVAHFAIPGASSHPGEVGNTALSGHSSNDLFDPGDYKFIFAQLDKLQKGDTIYANYEGVRYTYVVTRSEVVKPTEVGKLVYDTDKPMMTLITCTPLGTALNRLLVTAEQVSPDPSQATATPESQTPSGEADMPGYSPTLLERLFGA